ncbi:aspartic peptidase domain-containing protein [Blyttiomyces helicus]|uniref:Aspartic peptidase domain-containing protein n=1 Tax=Blyttiomyces helicus TaxID=388810 RepID=A0A4P9WCB2_9FUNG|nr:aspartic peptidase domain-containing protein [Blyttiomyces helicus]|eukprot:RKO87986.1 aspartic peptidase domain-containing protein [Blyttiomyces helicus]
MNVVKGGKFRVDKSSGNLSADGNVTGVVIDSGSYYITLPESVANAIWKEIGATPFGADEPGLAYIPCDYAKTGKSVGFTFSDTEYIVPASQYVMVYSPGYCMPVFVGGAETFGFSLFGDPFLRSWYTLFDIEHLRLGFAKPHA